MLKIRDSLLEEEINKRKSDRDLLLWILVFLIIMTTLVFFNTFVFLNIQVQQSSMEPTLYDGDILVVNTKRTPSYGDIIIIGSTENNKVESYWIIKRVIGLGGDTIEIKDGKVYRNNLEVPLDESYLPDGVFTDKNNFSGPVTLNENEIFYLGDNRGVSKDSRTLGPCKTENVVGVVEEWSIRTKTIRTFFNSIPEKIAEFLGINGCRSD